MEKDNSIEQTEALLSEEEQAPAEVAAPAPAEETKAESAALDELEDGAEMDVLPAVSVTPTDFSVSASEPEEEKAPAEAAAPSEETDQAPEQDASAQYVMPSSVKKTDATREYGAPEVLYEDFIPYEYLHGTPEESAAPKKAEEPPKKEKPKKPTKEEALLAAVEAEMAAREPDPAPAEEPAPAGEPPQPTSEKESAPAEQAAAPAPQKEKEETDMAEENKQTEQTEEEERELSSYEKKLRKKYDLDNDKLLSQNDFIPGFILAKGEVVVRSYDCLDSAKGEGTICLTNKRLLINADERTEMEISNVSGIKFARNTYFSFAKFLFGLIFLGLGVFMVILPFCYTGMNIPFITGDSWKSWFFYLFIICGTISVLISLPLWFTMVKRHFHFNIFIKEGAPFLECKSTSYMKGEKKGMQYSFMVSDAGKESDKAARELGALIIEVKEGRYNF